MGESGCKLHHLGSPGAVPLEATTAEASRRAVSVHLCPLLCAIAAAATRGLPVVRTDREQAVSSRNAKQLALSPQKSENRFLRRQERKSTGAAVCTEPCFDRALLPSMAPSACALRAGLTWVASSVAPICQSAFKRLCAAMPARSVQARSSTGAQVSTACGVWTLLVRGAHHSATAPSL